MWKKILFGAAIVVFAIAASGWYYVFEYSKSHHRRVEDENAFRVTAAQIVKDYETNEAAANTKYLNKAVEVKGVILKEEKDQAGNVTLTLKSGDPMTNILCTLKSKQFNGSRAVVVVKGVCTGFLSDVVLNEAVVEHLNR
ncbi:MAG: hypothetical protein JSU01_14000 [Bacteroidetes bacterium]|nr:hypothetical protein [Bacteroidota bacterium]